MPPTSRTLIDDLLAEQQRLTAVERFAQRHERGAVPAQERYYRHLIPRSAPAVGQQYAFAVDLDACTGCKACVSACHSLNGLDEDETWRSTGLLIGSDSGYQQTITTACHHCIEPGCLEGCPVLAYEKDHATGIVRHLDDQCIGCQYCVLKCPYDVPKYSERLGIVRKCDLCIDRLAVGEAPACVQACPTSAIRIELVDKAEVSLSATPGSRLVPGAFDSSYTKPATRYHSERGLPLDARAACEPELRLEHPHWPLIGMLLLTQCAAGLALATMVFAGSARVLASTGWLVLHAGLAVSVLHLGRPLGAWRFFLGLRTSWMSREILAFGLFAAAFTAMLLTAWVPPLRDLLFPSAFAATALGAIAVFTSAMIYIDTRRAWWSARLVTPKFIGTSLLLGSTTAAAVLAGTRDGTLAAIAATFIRTALFMWESASFRRLLRSPDDDAHRSALTIQRLLPWVPRTRAVLFAVSTVAGLLAITGGFGEPVIFALIAMLSTFASQLIERFCFFTAAAAPRMPGGVPA